MTKQGANSTPTLLILSQVYVPDPASVGQHMADAAVDMVGRGYRVRVLTSARGYDDPSMKYPIRESIQGVDVRRLRLSSFGKGSIAIRLLGGLLFTAQATFLALFMRRLDGILVSTSPPMCSLAAQVVSRLRGTPILYWVMDLNPDQMIAMGKITERSIPARVFNLFNRMILKRARRVVVLDRFMADRINRKRNVSEKISILPPWPHEDQIEPVPHEGNPFRHKHALDGKTVIMYSGNHSLANPLDTIVAAAERLKDREDIRFLFIGSGLAKKTVEDAIKRGACNIVSLPYQPLADLKYSLSAADVHLVTLGNDVVGIVHPCKVYGAMAVARPILFIGPKPSHVTDLLDNEHIGWHIAHGDVDAAVEVIESLALLDREELEAMGSRAQSIVGGRLSKDHLCSQFCDAIEASMARATNA